VLTKKQWITMGLALALGLGAVRGAGATPLLQENYLFVGAAEQSRSYDFSVNTTGVYAVILVDSLAEVPFASLGVRVDFLPAGGGSALEGLITAPGFFTFDVLPSDYGLYRATVTGTPGPGHMAGFPSFSTYGLIVDQVPGALPQEREQNLVTNGPTDDAPVDVPAPHTLLLALIGFASIALQRRLARAA